MLRTAIATTLTSGLLVACSEADRPAPGADEPPPRPAASAAAPASEAKPLPAVTAGSLVMNPGGVDFGLVSANSRHDARVSIRNAGRQAVQITGVQSTCQCTAPEDLQGTVLEPGGTVSMSSAFSARPVPGPQDAKVIVRFREHGSTAHQSLVMRIEAEVTLPIRAQPPYVDALEGVTSGTISLESIDGRPFRILSAQGAAPDFVSGGDESVRHAVRWRVNYPSQLSDCGGEKLWWVLETDHPDCPVIPLRIRHECTGMRTDQNYKERGWLFRDYIVNLGQVRAGEAAEGDVRLWRLGDRKTLSVRGVESTSDDATAEAIGVVEPPDDDTVVTVRLTPRLGYEGLLYAMVNVRTATGDKEIAFVARVVP